MAFSLETMLLTACKSGDIETVRLATSLRVDVNCSQGWGLRRSIRYNHPQIWDSLLLHRCINVNLCNQYGLSALHTACRFNIGSAVSDLLRHPGIAVNDQTVLGSTPIMVAVKYASKQAVQILIRDKRVDLDILDNNQRRLEDAIGVAVNKVHKEDKQEILSILQEERQFRQEGKGRRLSLEEEGLVIDSNHRTRVFGKLKELLEELKELQQNELVKIELRQEDESRQMQSQANYEINQLLANQEQERNDLMDRLLKEKEDMDTRHKVEIERLMKKQDEATQFLQKKSDGETGDRSSPAPTQASSPVQTQSVLVGSPVNQFTHPLTASPTNTNRLSVSSIHSLSNTSDAVNNNNNTIENVFFQHQLTGNSNPVSQLGLPTSQHHFHSSSHSINSAISEGTTYSSSQPPGQLESDQPIFAASYPSAASSDGMDGGYTNIGGVLPQAAGSGSILCQPPQSSSGSVVDLAGQPGGNLGVQLIMGNLAASSSGQSDGVSTREDGGSHLSLPGLIPNEDALQAGLIQHQLLVSGALGSAIGLPNSGLESVLRGSSSAHSGAGSDGQPATTGSSSPWETGARTPDEGYLTSKDQELPSIINSTCKELECPICMEVMAPPSRIWQCKMGHVICEPCKERVRKESGLSQSDLPCPTCKTAPFIGRNLALERVARSLFSK